MNLDPETFDAHTFLDECQSDIAAVRAQIKRTRMQRDNYLRALRLLADECSKTKHDGARVVEEIRRLELAS